MNRGRARLAFSPVAALAVVFLASASTGRAQGGACVPPPDGLVSWWAGDGDTNDLQNRNDGSPGGDVTFADGLAGRSFAFSGAGEVVVAPDESLNVDALTINAWVHPTLLDGGVEVIVNKEEEFPEQNRDIQWEIGIRGTVGPSSGTIPTGNLAFFLGRVQGKPDDYASWIDGFGAVPLNTWSHVALTFDGSEAVAYVNGSPTRTLSDLTGTLAKNDGPLKIGSRGDELIERFPNERFDGLIDEVQIFSRALEAEEIRAIFEAGAAGQCKAGACVGDCNHDGGVLINEVVLAVNIGLGLRPLSDCPAADPSGDGRVSINEIISAVNSGLFGC